VLSTILIGNNVVNTLMGAVVTALAIRHLEGTVGRVRGRRSRCS
jgi:putative hemolysin